MLEAQDDSQQEAQPQDSANGDTKKSNDPVDAAGNTLNESRDTASAEQESGPQDLNQNSDTIPDELPIDSGWDDIYEPAYTSSGQSNSESTRDFTEYRSDTDISLRDYLLEQINLRTLSDKDREAAEALIDAIDSNGYLTESLEDILQGLNRDTTNPLQLYGYDELEMVMRLIQQLDPQGCGARDVGECMSLQLQQMPTSTAGLQDALLIVTEHLELLAAHDYAKLKRYTKLNDKALFLAVSPIKSLIHALTIRLFQAIRSTSSPMYSCKRKKAFGGLN